MLIKLKEIIRQRRAGQKAALLIPGIVGYYILNAGIIHNAHVTEICGRLTMVYIVVISLLTANSLVLGFQDIYSRSGRNREHPLKGLTQAIQIVLFFVGAIIIVAILIDKSPSALLTGLGASAAVLMLVFKDSILGFVAGVQLSRNNMIRIGDWIQMPDGSANGTVEEITLNTIKVRNWDNTISTIPPYTLISSTFKNWRGMQESEGRRVDKMLYIDIRTIKICIDNGQKVTNAQLYREFITRYIHTHPLVVQDLDIIIAQRQAGQFGLPIEIYFFLTEKSWAEFEKIQSDIFDYLIAAASDFGLKLYQLPD